MIFERGNIGYFIAFIVLGAVLGSALGSIIVKMFPGAAIIKENFTDAVRFSVEIITFSLKLNIASILGIIAGIFIFKKI